MQDSITELFKNSSPISVCRHFSRLMQTGVYFLYPDNSAHYTFKSGYPSAQDNNDDLFHALFGNESFQDRPVIKATRPGETYVAVDIWDQGRLSGRLAAGPFLDTGEEVNNSCNDFAVSAAVVLYHFVYGKWIEEKCLTTDFQPKAFLTTERNSHISNSQPKLGHHHSIAYENQIYSLITDGNEKQLRAIMRVPPDGAYGLLDKHHPLRNLKNDCICVITLATRAAITGGLDSETALSASDDAIQNLELCEDIHSLYQLIDQVLCHLAQAVNTVQCLSYSYRINHCRSYITHHIYEKLSVAAIASRFCLSPEYLSGQFKKETGIRLTDYIQKAKAEEAKNLLLYSNKSLLEIASLLDYHDQSHLTKSFKKEYGVTPGHFRKSSFLSHD